MSRLLKFFIVCAAVFVVGLVLSIAGAATGGVEGFQKVAEDHEWINAGPGARITVDVTDLDFDTIESTGVTDVVIVGPRDFQEVISDYHLTNVIDPKAGTVVAIYGENTVQPSFEMDGKTLKILGGSDYEFDGINLDFSSDDVYPTVIVLCPDKQLDLIKINSAYTDVNLMDISFKKAEIQLNYGEVHAENVISKGMKIEADDGDVELSGELKGVTEVTLEAGDIDVDTKVELKDYTMQINAIAGDIQIRDKEIDSYKDGEEGYSYTQKGGKDTLILKSLAGDIEINSLSSEAIEL